MFYLAVFMIFSHAYMHKMFLYEEIGILRNSILKSSFKNKNLTHKNLLLNLSVRNIWTFL